MMERSLTASTVAVSVCLGRLGRRLDVTVKMAKGRKDGQQVSVPES